MTTKTEITRTFSKAHQQAGAPYRCRNGFTAKILEWTADAATGETAIGYFKSPSNEVFSAQWDAEGTEANSYLHAGTHNLVMAPLGFIDGRPVFVDDNLVRIDGHKWKAQASWLKDRTKDINDFRWPDSAPAIKSRMPSADLIDLMQRETSFPITDDNVAACRRVMSAGIARAIVDGQVALPGGSGDACKPDSAPVIQTKMTTDELLTVARRVPREANYTVAYHAVANAAIARAIKDGQVVPTAEANENAMEHYQRGMGERAARDMVVAQMVRARCLVICELNSAPATFKSIENMDLAAIIERMP